MLDTGLSVSSDSDDIDCGRIGRGVFGPLPLNGIFRVRLSPGTLIVLGETKEDLLELKEELGEATSNLTPRDTRSVWAVAVDGDRLMGARDDLSWTD